VKQPYPFLQTAATAIKTKLWALTFAATVVLVCNPARAQSEGTVTALCSTDQGWCEAAAREFTRVSGIRVLQVHKPTGESMAQLKAEAENPKTDLWWGGTGDPFLQAAQEGLLLEYKPQLFNDLLPWAQNQFAISGNRVGGFYSGAIGFGVNTEVLKKKNIPIPKCWADLLKPIYKGEIESSNPASSGGAYTILAGLVSLMGEDKAFDYMKALHKNITTYTRSSQAQARTVSRGEVGIGISFLHGFIGEIEKGFPVDLTVPCEGTGYEVGGIALVKGGRNSELAKRYYEFLLSPEGQALGAANKSYQQPANRKTPTSAKIINSNSIKLVDYDFKRFGASAERRRLIARWEAEVNSLGR
jgi:iron(III) transport system substrate-binding protein